VGLHPHEAEKFDAEREELLTLLDDDRVVAIGEIGLDYYRGRETREAQLRAFAVQLGWASQRALPVSVHIREAGDEVLAALRDAGVEGVLHCFSESPQLAEQALDLGLYLSFAGNLTFPRAKELRDTASRVPLERSPPFRT
jgi:TatD DNase family protein